jgi:hypothetical protein
MEDALKHDLSEALPLEHVNNGLLRSVCSCVLTVLEQVGKALRSVRNVGTR